MNWAVERVQYDHTHRVQYDHTHRVQYDHTHRVQYDHTHGRACSTDGSAEHASVRNRPKTDAVWTIRLDRAAAGICKIHLVECV